MTRALQVFDADRDEPALPLVIDLDGTLLATDSLHETALEAARTAPLALLRALGRAGADRAAVKAEVARLSRLDIDHWPIDPAVADWARREAETGRRVVLVSAADQSIVDAVARRFPFFAEAIGSDGVRNLKGRAKAELLARMFPDGFAYAGDSTADLPVFGTATERVVVGASSKLREAVERIGTPARVFERPGLDVATLATTLRLHQWAKNALVLVPLLLGGKAGDLGAWAAALAGFLMLGLTASATYLINDLWDVADDRRHWSKRQRAIASGRLPIRVAVPLAAGLLVLGFALAAVTGWGAVAMLSVYVAVTLAYSFGLKRFPIVDVFVLASLYTLRIGTGMVLADTTASPWLLVFSMFVFLSLSMAKRHTEVLRLGEHGLTAIAGRGYAPVDAPLTLGIGLAAMLGAVLILILYLIEDAFPRGFYATPDLLWAMPAILFLFLGRVWLVAQRGQMHDDPVAFALKDRASLLLGGLMSAVVVAAVIRI